MSVSSQSHEKALHARIMNGVPKKIQLGKTSRPGLTGPQPGLIKTRHAERASTHKIDASPNDDRKVCERDGECESTSLLTK
ncbi:hypothetical protein J6590_064244 [Homalodisca vitripennis]|nr:hypothetical protein J6590_064244 [Homalodisca vitripennis]